MYFKYYEKKADRLWRIDPEPLIHEVNQEIENLWSRYRPMLPLFVKNKEEKERKEKLYLLQY